MISGSRGAAPPRYTSVASAEIGMTECLMFNYANVIDQIRMRPHDEERHSRVTKDLTEFVASELANYTAQSVLRGEGWR
jgi:hypothetical protein